MIDEQTKQLIIDTARIDEVVLDTGMFEVVLICVSFFLLSLSAGILTTKKHSEMKQPQFLNLKALAKLFCMVALLSATSCARTADDIDISTEIPQERKMEPDASIEGLSLIHISEPTRRPG